jgi:hypothetical protein
VAARRAIPRSGRTTPKTRSTRAVSPSLGDVLLIHPPYDHWFLRRAYISEGGERNASLIAQDPSRDKMYKRALSEAKKQKGRVLLLTRAELKGDKEITTWTVVADYLDTD